MTKLQLTLKFLETRIDSRDFEFVKAIWSKGDVRPSRTVSIYGGGSGYDFIESIKVYRACTGLGLKEAKDAIEAAREKPVFYTFEDPSSAARMAQEFERLGFKVRMAP